MFRLLILLCFFYLYGCSQLQTVSEQTDTASDTPSTSATTEPETASPVSPELTAPPSAPADTHSKAKPATQEKPADKKVSKTPGTTTKSATAKGTSKTTDAKKSPETQPKPSDTKAASGKAISVKPEKAVKTDPASLFTQERKVDAEATEVDLNTMGVIAVLDLPFDPVENELSDFSSNNQDFASYGFFTPDEKLETLINEELDTLRAGGKPLPPKNNLLTRMRKQLQLDLDVKNPRIEEQVSWYTRNPDYLTRVFNRSARYLYHVVSEVERRGMPMELALLPFVESAYNPFAYSHGLASGLWQFIPETGKAFGMDQDWWYDGRRDVLASTDGALNYLSRLHERFEGNWLHALASYNSGSGRVSSAIQANISQGKKTDFWSLELPSETQAYVPKLLALAKITKNPTAYNINVPFIADAPYFEKVEIGGQIDLAQAAKMAQVDITEIYQLNPGFNQWASSPLGPHHLLVPVSKAELFRENIKKLPPEKRLNWHRYTVKRGDSLIKIAKAFQTTPMLIREVNHLQNNLIRARQKLLIPVPSKAAQYYNLSEDNVALGKDQRAPSKDSPLRVTEDKLQAKQASDKVTYKVRSGDTIWDLAREHKVSVRDLARWNNIAPSDPIHPGQNLVIWSNKPVLTALQTYDIRPYQKREMIQKVGYYVRKGDSLAKIANKFSVTIKDLISWNKLDGKKHIKPGQKLTIYVDITNS